MNSLTVTLIAFVTMFGGALAGMLLRSLLPDHHVRDDSRDVVKLAAGLIGTLAALVLGLLVASGKGFYDTQNAELTQLSANVVVLDRCLAHYGPEAAEVRESLRKVVVAILEQSWSRRLSQSIRSNPTSTQAESVYDQIQGLAPKNNTQSALQSQALSLAVNLGQMRWLMFEQGSLSVSKPLLVVMVFWLTVTFLIWGLLAAPNKTVAAAMLISALSAAGAIFLILEMYAPYQGLIRLSDAPLRAALAQLGQ
jgi:hypothetical protein